MLGPIAFIQGGIAALVSLWTYIEKGLGILSIRTSINPELKR